MSKLSVKWFGAGGRRATEPANPQFPEGVMLDLSKGAQTTCEVDIPYPAEGIGIWRVECPLCGGTYAVSAAGRADDPRWLRVGCKLGRKQ